MRHPPQLESAVGEHGATASEPSDAGDASPARRFALRVWEGPPGLTFLCVHGLMGSSKSWEDVAEFLRQRGTVVAPDLPGFGQTPLHRRLGTAGIADALSAVVEELPGPLVLVGTSMGAAVVAEVAADPPRPLSGVVLSSGYVPPYFGGWRAPAVVGSLLLTQLGNFGAFATAKLLAGAFESEADGPVPTALRGARGTDERPAAERALASVANVADLAWRSVHPGRLHELYGRIACPVLVVHGCDDMLVPAAWVVEAGRRHGWQVALLPAVAHVAKLANHEMWAGIVESWLRRKGISTQ